MTADAGAYQRESRPGDGTFDNLSLTHQNDFGGTPNGNLYPTRMPDWLGHDAPRIAV